MFGQPSRGLTIRNRDSAKIAHRARGHADVLAELRLDQNHNGPFQVRPVLVLSVPDPDITSLSDSTPRFESGSQEPIQRLGLTTQFSGLSGRISGSDNRLGGAFCMLRKAGTACWSVRPARLAQAANRRQIGRKCIPAAFARPRQCYSPVTFPPRRPRAIPRRPPPSWQKSRCPSPSSNSMATR